MNGDISSEAWENTYKKYSWWKEEMVRGVMTPKTHPCYERIEEICSLCIELP
jgi:hypothetical protein